MANLPEVTTRISAQSGMCQLPYFLPERPWMISVSVACTMSDQCNSLFAVLKACPRSITGFQTTVCDPSHTVVCLLPPKQLKGATIMLECVTGLLGGVSVDRLLTLCPFFCRPSCRGVLLTQLSDSSFIVTLFSPDLVQACPNYTTTFPTGVPDAFEVSIPGYCSLSEDDSTLVLPLFPCVVICRAPP